MTQERRRIALIAAAIASCMVVAVAARVDVADGSDAAFRLGPGIAQGGTALFVVIAIASLLLVAWAMWPQGGPRRPPRRRSWRDVLAFTVAALLLALLLSFFDRDRGGERRPLDQTRTELGNVDERTQTTDGGGDRASPTGSIAVAVVAVAALGAAALVALRRRVAGGTEAGDDDDGGGATGGGGESARVRVSAAAVAAAFAEDDPRASIRLAYRAAELVLAPTAARRAPTAAPREWLRAVRRSAVSGTTAPALATLVRAYEIARFSDHEPTTADRAAALDALRDLDAAASEAPQALPAAP